MDMLAAPEIRRTRRGVSVAVETLPCGTRIYTPLDAWWPGPPRRRSA